MSDNVYFMESELCMGTMNDKCVDKLHKKREPKHWNAKHSTTQSVVVARKGVCHCARIPGQRAATAHMSAHLGGSASHTLAPRLAQVMARVDVKHAHDPDEPFVSDGHALLEGLTPEERRSLLDQAPPCAAAPPATAVEAPPIGGALSFRSRSGTATISGPSKGRGHKRPRAAVDVGVAGKTGAGRKAPSGPLSFSFGEGDE